MNKRKTYSGIAVLANARPVCQFSGCGVEAVSEGIIAFVNLRWVGAQLYCFKPAAIAEAKRKERDR